MDTGKFIGLLVFALVGALVVVAFVPIIQETTSATDTFTNVGYYDMTYTETDNLVFEWDHTKPAQITVNDTVVILPVADSTPKTVICGDNWVVRYFENSGNIVMQFYGSSGSQISASVTEETDLELTCTNGTVAVTNTASTPATFSTTYTHLYVADNEGTLVMKDKDTPAYLNGDSEIVAMGLSRVGTVPNLGISVIGNIDDGFTWSIFRGSDVTFSDEDAHYTNVSGYIDLYQLDKLTATATNSTGSSDLTYNYFIVPAEVVAEKSIHPDNTLSTMINLLPFIAVIGLFMFLVAEFLYTRYL